MRERRIKNPAELARMAGIPRSQPYRLLNGGRPNAAAVTIAKIADALGTTSDYLMGLTDNRMPRDAKLTEDEIDLLEDFRQLAEEQKFVAQMLVHLIRAIGWDTMKATLEDLGYEQRGLRYWTLPSPPETGSDEGPN